MCNRILVCALAFGLAAIPFTQAPVWSQPRELGGSAIEYVEPPKGSNIRYMKDHAGGEHYEYLAPPNFNENPIHIYFEQEEGGRKNPKPDVYVWADVIHWNNTTESATATGRIVVDSEEYRIETSYVEYNHVTRQIYCPKRVVVIQKNPGKVNSRLEAEKATIKLDDDGIRDAKFDKILNSQYYIDRDKGPGKPKVEEKKEPPKADLPGASGISGPAE